jgi:hypothetical protein
MPDDDRPSSRNLPIPASRRLPAQGSVQLPADGGAWWGTPTTIQKKNAQFVRAHADYLDARATQARSAQAYIDGCYELARSIARLDWLPEVLEDDYLRGKLDRAHAIEMARIGHATAEAQARLQLLEALEREQRFQAPPQQQPTAFAPMQSPGLSPDEVEEIIASLPEASEEMRRTISLLLKGRLKEKQG